MANSGPIPVVVCRSTFTSGKKGQQIMPIKTNENLEKLLESTLDGLPAIMTTSELAVALGMSSDALSQDRYRTDGKGIPFTRIGRRVRYLKPDVVSYLVNHRCGN